MQRRYRAEQYPGLLTADPPVCAIGPALAVLRRCERIRLGQSCFCRILSRDAAEDLIELGAADQAEFLSGSLEPEDVEAMVAELQRIDLSRVGDVDLVARVEALIVKLRRLVRYGAGLTDRYSDDLD